MGRRDAQRPGLGSEVARGPLRAGEVAAAGRLYALGAPEPAGRDDKREATSRSGGIGTPERRITTAAAAAP